MRFANPAAFALLLLLPVALWLSLRPRRRGTSHWSHLGLTAGVPVGWSVAGPVVLAGLRTLALALLVVALARPQQADAQTPGHAEGVVIQFVLDVSPSMKTADFDLDGRPASRLDAVRHALRTFVEQGRQSSAGPHHKIGLITFAREPEVICPATLDHQTVLEAVERLELAPPVGTNIGDALAWAVDRLRTEPTRQKVIVLLSDGAQNAKEALQPGDAAALATALGLRVYTIGAVGGKASPASGGSAEDGADEPTLQQIAETTGGRYFRATDTDGLLRIGTEIDELETTRWETTSRRTFREFYLLLLIPAVGLLVVEQALAASRLLRVP